MKLNGNTYTFLFAAIVCVVCSLSLSAVSQGLRSKQELNVALDIKKNILKAVELREPLPKGASAQQVLDVYNQKIQELVIDDQGNIVEGKDPADIRFEKDEGLYPLYVYKEDDQVMAYAYPIVGKGLWSTLYGYFAMNPDGETVKGITFYKHGETPGLGAEIEKDWFQDNFKGKKIWDDKRQELTPIKVVKGEVEGRFKPEEAEHLVDGISGATMTSKGVTKMLHKWIKKYDPFFEKVRKGEVDI